MEPNTTSNSNSNNNLLLEAQSDQLRPEGNGLSGSHANSAATNSDLSLPAGVNMNAFVQEQPDMLNPSTMVGNNAEGSSVIAGPLGSMAENRLAMSNSRGDIVSAAPLQLPPSSDLMMSQTSLNPVLSGVHGLPAAAYNPYSAMMYHNILFNQQGLVQPNVLNQVSALGGISSLGSCSGLVGGNSLLPTTRMSHQQTQQAPSSAFSLVSQSATAKISSGYTNLPPPASSVRNKKLKGKPKRPLSAYNLFFKHERAKILESLKNRSPSSEEEGESSKDRNNKDDESSEKKGSDTESEDQNKEKSSSNKKKTPHGKIGFENLAKAIGQRWSQIDKEELEKFKKMALQDMKRYKEEMNVFLNKQLEIQEKERKSAQQLAQSEEEAETYGKRKFDQLSDQSLQEEEKAFEHEEQLSNPLQRQQLHIQQLQQQLQQHQQQQQLQNLVLQQQQALFDMNNAQKIQQDSQQGRAGGGNADENAVDQNFLAELMAQQNAGLGGLNNFAVMQGLRGMGGANIGGIDMIQQNNMIQALEKAEDDANFSQNGQNGNAQ